MLKAKLILIAVRLIMGAIALGLGIWYLSASLNESALTYTSMKNFLTAAGVEMATSAVPMVALCVDIYQIYFPLLGMQRNVFGR